MFRGAQAACAITLAAIVVACTAGQAVPTSSPSVAATPSSAPTRSPSLTPAWTASPAATSTAAPTASATFRAPLPAGEAWIAYQAITDARQGAHAIHFIRTDGTGDFFALPMVPGGIQKHPEWSPDGMRMALDVADNSELSDIWIVDLSAWTASKLVDCSAPCLWVEEPAWSHDGSRIAYQRHTNSGSGEVSAIEIIDVATGATSVVYETGSDKGVYAPRWSPDDDSLVFEQTAGNGNSLLGVSLEVLDIAHPGVTRTIVPADKFANNSDWIPNGSLIAFSAPITGGEPGGSLSDIWVVKPDGTEPRRVTDVAATGGTAVQPTFTSDGANIIFKLSDSRVQASDAMALIPVAGGDAHPATGSNYLYGWHPRLRPTP